MFNVHVWALLGRNDDFRIRSGQSNLSAVTHACDLRELVVEDSEAGSCRMQPWWHPLAPF